MTIPVSAALLAHFAQPYQTTSKCWQVELKNGSTLYFTDHNADLVISGWSAPHDVLDGTYVANTGFTASDIGSSGDLSIDDMQLDGMLDSPSITEADLHAGVWDNAFYRIFVVNWADLSDSMGPMIVHAGWLGEVSSLRNAWRATLDGLAQAYTRVIGELTSPGCRNDLGDARCQVDLAPFTVSGTVSGVAVDNQTFYDTGRTEPGPTGGVLISSISGGNVVTMRAPGLPDLPNGAAITISGCTGSGNAPSFNTVTVYRNPDYTVRQFLLPVNLTGTYTTDSGSVTPLGADTGYFDYGVVTWLTGNNAGLRMEVRSYVPGQFTLQEPMPYAIQAGDTYSAHAGCDKSEATCFSRFSNVINFRGEPYLPGNDKIMQVGKQ